MVSRVQSQCELVQSLGGGGERGRGRGEKGFVVGMTGETWCLGFNPNVNGSKLGGGREGGDSWWV